MAVAPLGTLALCPQAAVFDAQRQWAVEGLNPKPNYRNRLWVYQFPIRSRELTRGGPKMGIPSRIGPWRPTSGFRIPEFGVRNSESRIRNRPKAPKLVPIPLSASSTARSVPEAGIQSSESRVRNSESRIRNRPKAPKHRADSSLGIEHCQIRSGIRNPESGIGGCPSPPARGQAPNRDRTDLTPFASPGRPQPAPPWPQRPELGSESRIEPGGLAQDSQRSASQ